MSGIAVAEFLRTKGLDMPDVNLTDEEIQEQLEGIDITEYVPSDGVLRNRFLYATIPIISIQFTAILAVVIAIVFYITFTGNLAVAVNVVTISLALATSGVITTLLSIAVIGISLAIIGFVYLGLTSQEVRYRMIYGYDIRLAQDLTIERYETQLENQIIAYQREVDQLDDSLGKTELQKILDRLRGYRVDRQREHMTRIENSLYPGDAEAGRKINSRMRNSEIKIDKLVQYVNIGPARRRTRLSGWLKNTSGSNLTVRKRRAVNDVKLVEYYLDGNVLEEFTAESTADEDGWVRWEAIISYGAQVQTAFRSRWAIVENSGQTIIEDNKMKLTETRDSSGFSYKLSRGEVTTSLQYALTYHYLLGNSNWYLHIRNTIVKIGDLVDRDGLDMRRYLSIVGNISSTSKLNSFKITPFTTVIPPFEVKSFAASATSGAQLVDLNGDPMILQVGASQSFMRTVQPVSTGLSGPEFINTDYPQSSIRIADIPTNSSIQVIEELDEIDQ